MDLSFLRVLYDRPGPFASVYLDTRHTETPRALEMRRRLRYRELADQGAPQETLAAVEGAVQDEKRQRVSGCLAVFACGGEVAYATALNGAPQEEVARYAPLPHVAPLLEQRGEQISRLVAVVSRLGARLTFVTADGRRWDAEVSPSVESPVHKPKGGDMLRQPHLQQAADEACRANARKTAREIEQAADTYALDVVVVAGDVRARAAVLEHLSEPVLARTVESRSAEGPCLHEDVAEALQRTRTARMTSAVERFEERLTKGRRAVDGLPGVVGALRNAQVGSLLIDGRADGRTPVWTGPRCTDLATTPGELRDLGVSDPVEERADAALVRALAGTDGELFMIAMDGWRADHGLGALLRFGNRPSP